MAKGKNKALFWIGGLAVFSIGSWYLWDRMRPIYDEPLITKQPEEPLLGLAPPVITATFSGWEDSDDTRTMALKTATTGSAEQHFYEGRQSILIKLQLRKPTAGRVQNIRIHYDTNAQLRRRSVKAMDKVISAYPYPIKGMVKLTVGQRAINIRYVHGATDLAKRVRIQLRKWIVRSEPTRMEILEVPSYRIAAVQLHTTNVVERSAVMSGW